MNHYLFISFLALIINLELSAQDKFIIDRQHQATIEEGEYIKYFNVIEQKMDSVVDIVELDNKLVIITDTLVVDISYQEEYYEAIWKVKKNNKVIQKGFFNKDRAAYGKFYAYNNLDSAFCFYYHGIKEGLQLEAYGKFTHINTFKNGKLDGISYVLQDGYLLKNMAHVENGKLHGSVVGHWVLEDDLVLHFSHVYKNGVKEDGESIIYHPNGKVFMRTYFLNGKEDGWHTVYDDEGYITRKVRYSQGKVMEIEK